MKSTLAFALAAVSAFSVLSFSTVTARAQTEAPTPGAADPSFSAWSLVQQCAQKSDNTAQGQYVGAVRGIVRGYQYGVLFFVATRFRS